MFDRHLFAAAIKSHILQHDLSLREAAKESGVSVATLSRLTHGEIPDIENFALIAKWLEVDANQFLEKPQGKLLQEDQGLRRGEAWVGLYCNLQELGVSEELIEAIATIVRLNGKD